MNQSVEMVKTAFNALSDKKGEDITIIDIQKVSVMADYFIIASGTNSSQVQAMVDNVENELGRKGFVCKQMEGYRSANWILMDYGDIIIHVFDRENRLFYDLERIWRDGKTVELEALDNL
jgi:ribosome-associated protein